MKEEIKLYNSLLYDIRNRVRQGQLRANLSANAEMLTAYWDIGKMIHERQQAEGWGKGVIPRLSKDLRNELVDVKGFSVRNIQMMIQFYIEYQHFESIAQRPVAQLDKDEISAQSLAELKRQITQLPVAQLQSAKYQSYIISMTGWAQHTILIQKIKDLSTRYWYMLQCLQNGWSRDTLSEMIKTKLHVRQQRDLASNFDLTLPPFQSALAKQLLKDPYIFDFLTLNTEYTERELETELIKHVEKFLVELGAGFAFVGRQFKLEISDKDFYLDLLFYHLKMRCFVVIELKKGDFIPEYAGKMNFYCSAVDDLLRHPADEPTIGLILCQGTDRLFAEYALRDIRKPIGISEYELTRMLPDKLKSSLPSVEEIEAELNQKLMQ
ncbi:MAG: DUF1016 domain-containing protein [Bacteroidales bacterium]|nr:DUF1016 domain-containing protein [Bacteroidales bacterium]